MGLRKVCWQCAPTVCPWVLGPFPISGAQHHVLYPSLGAVQCLYLYKQVQDEGEQVFQVTKGDYF